MSAAARHRPDSAALFVLAAVSLALLTILSVWKLKQFKYRLINETGGAMFYGKWVQSTELSTKQLCLLQGTFDPEVLFDLFLPAVIFYVYYSLHLFNLNTRACMYGFTRLVVLLKPTADGKFFLTDCLLFGAIMSATDPVSVLGLLSDLRVDFDLRTLLFGESVLNDAVAIVLTHAIATYDQMGAGRIFDPPAFFHSVGFFLGVLIGSFLLGFVFAVITALISFHPLPPLLETSVFFLLSWSSFLSAEACGLSGIVAVLFCGLSQARYTILNLSHEGRTRTKQLFEVFNFLGEIFIFSYMGYIWFTFPHHVFEALFILGAFLSIFISRACNIYSLSFLLNLGRTNKISWAVQHFMVFAGLRGVIAFSLAIRDTSTEVKKTILTTTLLLVVFTVWVLGAAADPLLRRLDLRLVLVRRYKKFDANHLTVCSSLCIFSSLFMRYLKPLLTHCGPPLTDSLPRWCGGFAKVFSSSRLQETNIYVFLLQFAIQDEEQLCEAQPDASTVSLEKTELTSTRSDSGSEHQEDLLEGDLGLGAGVSPRPEFPGVSSNDDLSSPPPTAHGDTGQGI
uniref:Solute carrier family 9 member A9 n=1 Tax=Kryptolebias marmoratus TaxID=37003 RepID=A0A3Q3FTQ8_KRYMA